MNNNEFSPILKPDRINGNHAELAGYSGGTGCTQALITGLTSLHGNMTGQCVDGSAGMWPGFIRLVIPDEGNRYLTVGGAAEEIFPLGVERSHTCTR